MSGLTADPEWKPRLLEAIHEAEADDYVVIVIAPHGRISYNSLDDYFRGMHPKPQELPKAPPVSDVSEIESEGTPP